MMWLAGLALMGLATGKAVEFTSHRGESADAPENTMAAFQLAWERDADAFELDAHLTADGKLVVIHDGDTKRTTGVAKLVKESTLEELRALDAGRWKGTQWAGEKLPTIEEALATIPDGKRCFIEIKVGPEAVPALVEAVRGSGKKPEQLAVISFQADTVAETKKQLPELKAFFLSGFRQDKETGAWTPSVDDLIAKAKSLGADGLDLHFRGPFDSALVRTIKDAGLELYVWTVDEVEDARRLIEAGVDGITSNKAAMLKQTLGRPAE